MAAKIHITFCNISACTCCPFCSSIHPRFYIYRFCRISVYGITPCYCWDETCMNIVPICLANTHFRFKSDTASKLHCIYVRHKWCANKPGHLELWINIETRCSIQADIGSHVPVIPPNKSDVSPSLMAWRSNAVVYSLIAGKFYSHDFTPWQDLYILWHLHSQGNVAPYGCIIDPNGVLKDDCDAILANI